MLVAPGRHTGQMHRRPLAVTTGKFQVCEGAAQRHVEQFPALPGEKAGHRELLDSLVRRTLSYCTCATISLGVLT